MSFVEFCERHRTRPILNKIAFLGLKTQELDFVVAMSLTLRVVMSAMVNFKEFFKNIKFGVRARLATSIGGMKTSDKSVKTDAQGKKGIKFHIFINGKSRWVIL